MQKLGIILTYSTAILMMIGIFTFAFAEPELEEQLPPAQLANELAEQIKVLEDEIAGLRRSNIETLDKLSQAVRVALQFDGVTQHCLLLLEAQDPKYKEAK